MRLSKITHKHTVFIFFTIACLLLALGLTTQQSQSATGTNCGPEYSILGNGSGTPLLGVINLKLAVPTAVSPPISKVIFRANGKPIGRAQPTGSYTWSMPWDTSLHPAGTVSIDAEVYRQGQSEYCAAAGFSGVIDPGAQPPGELEMIPTPPSWEGPKSFSDVFAVTLHAPQAAFDPTIYALYTWQTSIGTFASTLQNTAQFTSGTTEGQGAITVIAKYGGKTITRTIPVTVRSLTAPLPDPDTDDGNTQTTTNTSTSTSGSDSTTTSSGSTSTVTTQATLQNNPIAQNCIVAAIGKERYEVINTGKARPTTEEIQKFKACFASSNYILPYNFAPVEPTKVKELKRTDAVKLEKPTNTTVKNEDETEKDALVFSGTAEPNSTVMIYVFSNPLVLTTTANANGEWTYTLEDPIEPGDHEVYTVVDRGDGVYERSDPIAFSIVGTAEAAGLDSNPSGLSLRLSDQVTPSQSRRSLVLYALASLGTIIVVGVIVLLSLRIRHKKTAPVEPATTDQPATTPSEQSPTPEPTTIQATEEPAAPAETVAPTEPITIEPTTQPEPQPSADETPTEAPVAAPEEPKTAPTPEAAPTPPTEAEAQAEAADTETGAQPTQETPESIQDTEKETPKDTQNT